ncbi:MAG: helix-turn-helix domain-containing protein [Actinomycetia bacterium]|nr:helix-turn-helix domain-containing protein [Actinomycetes bacterium]
MAGRAPDFLTVEEAARVLRIGRTAAYQLTRRYIQTSCAEGTPAEKIGRQVRVPRFRLEATLGGPIRWPPIASAVDPITTPPRRHTQSKAANRTGRPGR